MEIDFIVQDHIACLTIDRSQRHIVGTTGCGRLRWDRIYELHHPIRPFCCPCRGRRTSGLHGHRPHPRSQKASRHSEAFAAQAIPRIRELGLDRVCVNPNGEAIALGHPLGATGAVLPCKALSALQRTRAERALVTMCIGGGHFLLSSIKIKRIVI